MRLLLCSFLLATCLDARRFMPRNNAKTSNPENFVKNQVICPGDTLSFSAVGEDPTVAVIDRELDLAELEFMTNGVIYLNSDMEIGKELPTSVACLQKPVNDTMVYFDRYASDLSVYDISTWEEMLVNSAPTFELHMNRLPGAADDVEIFEMSMIHFNLYENFAVKSWQDWKRQMTTDDFVHRLRTLEGQMAFRLGPQLVHEYDVNDRIALMRPIGEPIRVGDYKPLRAENFYGMRNPNLDNKTMTTICSRVKCDNEKEAVPPRCIQTFVPKGHCCPVCGVLMEVQTYQQHLARLESILDAAGIAFKKKYRQKPDEFYYIKTERLDETDYEFQYQVVLIVRDTSSVLDEDMLKDYTAMVLREMGEYWHRTEGFQLLQMKESVRDHSYATSSIILGILFYIVFGATATFYFSLEARNRARFVYHHSVVFIDRLRARVNPGEVEMTGRLVEGTEEQAGGGEGGGQQMVSLAEELGSDCELTSPSAISFSNKAFSMSVDNVNAVESSSMKNREESELEEEPPKQVDDEGMSCIDLL